MKQSNLGPGMLHVFLSVGFVTREARNPRAVMEVETVKRVRGESQPSCTNQQRDTNRHTLQWTESVSPIESHRQTHRGCASGRELHTDIQRVCVQKSSMQTSIFSTSSGYTQ